MFLYGVDLRVSCVVGDFGCLIVVSLCGVLCIFGDFSCLVC